MAAIEASGASLVQCTAAQAPALAARSGSALRCLVQGATSHCAPAIAGTAKSSGPRPGVAERELVRWLHGLGRRRLANILNVNAAQISIDLSFSQLGIDSLKAVEIIGRLSDDLGIELSPTLLFEFATLRKLSEHLVRAQSAALARAAERHGEVVAQ